MTPDIDNASIDLDIFIKEDDKDYFVLENTKGEVYRLDISWKGEYKTGDGVILVYTQRQEIEEGVYEAEVFFLF